MEISSFLRIRNYDIFSWDRMDCHSGDIIIWVLMLVFITHGARDIHLAPKDMKLNLEFPTNS